MNRFPGCFRESFEFAKVNCGVGGGWSEDERSKAAVSAAGGEKTARRQQPARVPASIANK